MKKGDVMSSGFVLGRGRQPMNLSEKAIRYAMKNSKSNSGASRFLNISLTTYEKYSKRYIDEETGKTLWEIQKNKRGLGIKKPYNITKGKYALKDILEGKYPEYSVHQLKRRLMNNADKVDFPCKCHNCGYDERRITDNKIPLVLDHIDDNWTNHIKENIRFLCYNCFHNLKGNIRGGQPQWRIEQVQKAKETIKLNKKKEESNK
jgi:hypothetical protein|tara:strand:+ start:780 stop:1394 length:615 start_codon:yes stop_codon:yes gene_type:complete